MSTSVAILPEKSVATKLKKFGFKTFDPKIVSHINTVILNFVIKTLKVNLKGQKGGRIVLPMEYFGVQTNEYSSNNGPFTDMAISSDYIRPPMDSTFGQFGGVAVAEFKVPQKEITAFLTEAAAGRPVNDRKEVIKVLTSKVSEILTQFFMTLQKQAKGQTHLDVATFEAALKKRAFSKLKL